MIYTRFTESVNLMQIMLCEYHQNQDMQGYMLFRKQTCTFAADLHA